MEKYITQLLEEMRSAHRVQNQGTAEFDLESHFADIDRYTSGDADQVIGNILGISPEQFPPAGQLSRDQQDKVVHAFKALLQSWNLCAEFPENLPLIKQYQLLVTTLNMETTIMNYGMVHLEFCDYDPQSCPFGQGFCSCKDFVEEL